MNLSNENVIHIKQDEIEYLQFRRLLEYKDNIIHAFTLGVNNDYRIPLSGSGKSILTNEQIEKNKNSYFQRQRQFTYWFLHFRKQI